MADRVHETTLERTFPAPRSVVWALVADTNRWDRAYGLSPGTYRWREHDGRRERTATARELGFDLEWVEPPYQWIEGRFVLGERVFTKGPVARGGFRVELTDVAAGTRAVATAYVTTSSTVGHVAAVAVQARQKKALVRYLDTVGSVLSQLALPTTLEAIEPAVAQARRLLLGARYDEVVAGRRGPTDVAELERRAKRLLDGGVVSSPLVSHLVMLLRDAPDEALAQMRPFELARAWSLPRRDVLQAFLHATRFGLVDLRWQINCPVCRVAAGIATGLADLRREAHCDACNIDYGVDLAQHIEAVFVCNAALRQVETAVYCASSPAFQPHVSAQLAVEPGAHTEHAADLERTLHVRTLDGRRRADLSLEAAPSELVIDVTDDAIRVVPRGVAGPTPSKISVNSSASASATVLVERAGWSADAVLGSVVASFPEFVHLFATEAPASGVDLAVSYLALLFTDLTGSTAAYERLGDARAFALVLDHFADMETCVQRHGGAVVKTMGDAVMASFARPDDAVRAAVAMIESNHARHAKDGLGLKVGVHAGPCLAVRANERLDFFGTTVNVAARMQAQAHAGELVLSKALASEPTVAAMLAGRRRRDFSADLKGIREPFALVGVAVVESVAMTWPPSA